MENQTQVIEEKPKGVRSVLYTIEEVICITAMALLALIPIIEIIYRLIIKSGLLGSTAYITHLLLFTGLLSGVICTKSESHLAISLVHYIPEGRIRQIIRTCCNLISAFVCIIIAWSSISFIKIGFDSSEMVGIFPKNIIALIIPIAFAIIAIRFARRTVFTGWKIIFPILVLVLGTIASFPVIVKFIWGFEMSDAMWDLTDKFYDFAYYARTPVVILLLVSAFAGTPLFVVIGGLTLILFMASGVLTDAVAGNIYTNLINSNIVAIPLFTIAGFLLSESKAGERLVKTFQSLFSWIPGGTIIVTVIICAFFTSFTGASGVTILALGGILYTMLHSHLKYPEKFTIGLLTSVGSIGLLFPPSLPLILVGTVMQTNIIHLFLGGIIPGIILVVAMAVFGIFISVKNKIPIEKFEVKKALFTLKDSAFEMLLPVFLIAGYFTGILSLVEIGAAAVLYVFIVEVLIHRDIKISQIKNVFIKAIPIIGGVLSILALSKALSDYIVFTQAPSNIAAWMHSALSSKFVFLLLLNLALIVVGCLMDIFSAILIVLPLIIPLGAVYGIDPVHLGIIFIVNLEVGYITPPVGLNLFLSMYRFKKPFVEICSNVAPYLIVRLAVVLLVTYLPWISTFLVGLLG